MFAPGQRFDVRLEANDIQAPPKEFSIQVNGVDRTREIFGGQEFVTFPLLDGGGRPSARLGGGVMRRAWSLDRPGRYQISAALILADGARLTAQTTVEAVALTPERTPARNIILFIGDGLGVAQRTAARIVSRGIQNGKVQGLLEMDAMDAHGFIMTHSLDAAITDSSPSAGAYATGNKGVNNSHGVFPDNTGANAGASTAAGNAELARLVLDNPRIENIAELLQRTRRMATGVVSTVSVTDSTPAAFSSHTFARTAEAGIAEQILESGHSVIMGAGTRFFAPAGSAILGNIRSGRTDGRNLIEEFQKAGYTFASNASGLEAAARPQKLLALFHPRDMPSRFDRMRARAGDPNGREALGQFPDQPDLETMTLRAIDILSRNPNGFFLMVEAGSIDRQYHMMDPHRAIFETIELDKAVGAARAWARRQGNAGTLILVTGDHETSGLSITGVMENGRAAGRGFPSYVDENRDGFPDNARPQRMLAFDFAGTPAAANENADHYYELPRNLIDLNPTSPRATPLPRYLGHTATDIFIAASGPGANLFGRVMDNTDVFFAMLRAVGYR